MKNLHETFADQEFVDLQKAKKDVGMNWHDFIMLLTEFCKDDSGGLFYRTPATPSKPSHYVFIKREEAKTK